MLSNVGAGSLARRFQPGELGIYFDCVVESAEIGFAKPEPRAYEITAEKLDLKTDECVFTDDRSPYCDGARAVGMRPIQYHNFEQFKKELESLLANPE